MFTFRFRDKNTVKEITPTKYCSIIFFFILIKNNYNEVNIGIKFVLFIYKRPDSSTIKNSCSFISVGLNALNLYLIFQLKNQLQQIQSNSHLTFKKKL